MQSHVRSFLAVLSILSLNSAAVAQPQTRAAAPTSTSVAASTYCNPLSIPNFPIGRNARDLVVGSPTGANDGLWLLGHKEQFRELADVSVLWHEGKWYMYPSVDMAWVSGDGGLTWQHHPLNVRDLGYAPTIVKHRGKFLLMGSGSAVHTADSPLGPFTPLGRIPTPRNLPGQTDPMLYSDDDGRLFFYWGCTPNDGIYGVELDPEDPTKLRGGPQKLIAFQPDIFPWQRVGDWNENINNGWIEGSWMLKRNGTYYLTYCAAGTENGTYAVGCATSKSPLGPFEPQKNNPVLRTTTGLVTGASHGSFVEGPNGSLWAFYTLRAAVIHGFERRLGMDPAWIGDDGELHVSPASSLPMRLTGTEKGAEPAGWLPLNSNRQTRATSTAANLNTRLAVDNDLRTWWQPDADDQAPALTSNFTAEGTAHAVRIAWRDIGLNTRQGANPGPFRYKVELLTGPNTWTTVLDRSDSTEDLVVDYRECPPTKASAARLVIAGAPAGITPGVAEFTVFGEVTKH